MNFPAGIEGFIACLLNMSCNEVTSSCLLLIHVTYALNTLISWYVPKKQFPVDTEILSRDG
jgi:hypothetical protein